MVLNQTLGLNALRQDLNRLFYSAPIGTSGFAPNGFYGQTGFYAPSPYYAHSNFFAPSYYAQGIYGQQGQTAGHFNQSAGFQGHFVPKANFAETPEATIVTIELPGVELNQVSLSIQGNALVLDGVRQPGGLLGNQMVTYQATEGRFGSFRWACAIPNGTMAPQIEAICRNGLLTIVLPKATAQVGIAGLAQAGISAAPVAQIVISPAVNG